MMMGTGMIPGPFARADFRGLDDVLAALEKAEDEWGEDFEPPLVLRRLVAQGRLGAKSGQGFYPYPQPDEGYETAPVKLDTRGDDRDPVARQPARQLALARTWSRRSTKAWAVDRGRRREGDDPRLAEPGAVLRGRRHQGVHAARRGAAAASCSTARTSCSATGRQSRTMTIAAVNGLAFGGGCEIAMACDVRLAGYSASFGQPEINLGIIPGFGGTQRLPRLVGPAKALEMNTTGEPISAEEAYEYGLVNRLVPDHELFDTALAVGAQVRRPGAARARGRSSASSHQGDLDDGIAAEKEAFASVFASEDAREGIGAFLQKRNAGVQGQVSARPHDRLAELIRSARSVVALTGAGVSVPSGIPDFRSPGHRAVGERRPDGGRPHLGLAARPGALLGASTGALRAAARARSRTARTARWPSSSSSP